MKKYLKVVFTGAIEEVDITLTSTDNPDTVVLQLESLKIELNKKDLFDSLTELDKFNIGLSEGQTKGENK